MDNMDITNLQHLLDGGYPRAIVWRAFLFSAIVSLRLRMYLDGPLPPSLGLSLALLVRGMMNI